MADEASPIAPTPTPYANSTYPTLITATLAGLRPAVRFSFPPALFIVPLALTLALHRRHPWPMPGQPVTTVVGGAVFS
jgi:hypothetical protein